MRIREKMGMGQKDKCWVWKGRRRGDGYGQIRILGTTMNAHRAVWILENGKMPKPGYVIMHSCDNRICVNPSHLSEGTPSENGQDMVRKGRAAPNAMNDPEIRRYCSLRRREVAKLNLEDVENILARLARGDRPIRIAESYGVTSANVCAIRDGRIWKDVKRPGGP